MKYGELAWPEVAQHLHKVVVAPIGSLEQHGHHLPLLTDSLIGQAIADRAEAALGDEALFLPMLWLGSSHHHMAFPGTVSLTAGVYTQVLIDLVESLIAHGFRRIFLLNAHAGNIVPAQSALYEVNLRHRKNIDGLWLAFISWFDLAKEQVAAIDGVTQRQVLHACEWETSVIMASHGDLVRESRHSTKSAFKSRFLSPDFSGPNRVYVAQTIDQSSAPGSYGRPDLATREKGEAMIDVAAKEVIDFIREFATWQVVKPEIV